MSKRPSRKSKLQRNQRKRGLPPGSLVYTGEFKGEIKGFEYISYNDGEYEHQSEITQLEPLKDGECHWVNVTGLNNTALVGSIGKHFKINSLILEDILNTQQRPKIDDLRDQLFVVLKMLSLSESKEIIQEQVSFILTKDVLISFQEFPGDVFDPIRERIAQHKGLVRSKGMDYLLYLLMDVVVDNYFIITDELAERIEQLEDTILRSPEEEHLSELQEIRKDLLVIRKSLTPLRDGILTLKRNDNPCISEDVYMFYDDLSDHIFHLNELIESYREINTGLKDMYMNSVSMKMNKVMQTLTIVSTIFIPLSFLVGVYGMNFEVMPELKWEYSYYVLWGVMLGLVLIMLFLFKRRKWF